MRPFFIVALSLVFTTAFASPGDTLKVQTFTFGSKQDSTFFFPTAGKEYRKVLMYYTLKCNSKQTPACGEWDYLTYTYLWKKVGDTTLRYEIARFITPYGNGLSLGNGFTWTFDVTDYATLFQDSVRLAAGNWQELLDIKFAFIEGPPVRKIQQIVPVWSGNVPYLVGITKQWGFDLPDVKAEARMKVRVTGHGFGGNENCAEFCPKTHSLSSLTSPKLFWSKKVWRENCGLNPVYPQGGTWVYQRANWCPGAEVETYDVEIPLAPEERSAKYFQLRYQVEDYSWNGQGTQPYYAMEAQMVYYDPSTVANDASVEEILTPSRNPMYTRMNPDCSSPMIIIRNNGKDTLKSVTIEYGVPDGKLLTYTWKGSLAFAQKETVTLPKVNEWWGDFPRFKVTLKNPNGKTDEYQPDNTAYSYVNKTPVLPYKIVVYFKSNNAPEQNSYEIRDEDGRVVGSKSNFAANTIYRDTFTLQNGCYTFRLKDAGENGLTWWAAPDDGNGVIRIQSETGKILKGFNADFGAEVLFNFSTGWAMTVPEAEVPKALAVYPSPAETVLTIDLASIQAEKGRLEVLSANGGIIVSGDVNTAQEQYVRLNINGLASGLYIVRFITAECGYHARFIRK
jgi:hypothetical protein